MFWLLFSSVFTFQIKKYLHSPIDADPVCALTESEKSCRTSKLREVTHSMANLCHYIPTTEVSLLSPWAFSDPVFLSVAEGCSSFAPIPTCSIQTTGCTHTHRKLFQNCQQRTRKENTGQKKKCQCFAPALSTAGDCMGCM